MNKVIVKLENFSKSYGKKEIIKNLNLEVYEGEFLTLLGSSGCGKTTILRSISGLDYPTSGKIYLDGVDVTDLDLSSAASNTFYPHMKVNDDNYDNGGANANGDIRDRGLTFKETTITLNGKKYWMHSQYSMPVLTITNA